MKKHDEGYVLAFVMVVITVLCLVAVSLLPISLRNLQAQTDSIRRMQDKYEAQGVVETVVAKMGSPAVVSQQTDLRTSLEADFAAYLAEVDLNGKVNILDEDYTEVKDEEGKTITGFSVKVKIISESANGSTEVKATLRWSANVTETGSEYQIIPSSLEYVGYLVSPGEGAADE